MLLFSQLILAAEDVLTSEDHLCPVLQEMSDSSYLKVTSVSFSMGFSSGLQEETQHEQPNTHLTNTWNTCVIR